MILYRAIGSGANSLVCRLCCRPVSSKAWKLSPQRRALLEKIIRVDHAGEHGAVKIYQGQILVLGRTAVGPILEDFLEQEKKHLSKFEKLLPEYRTQPTVMLPLWTVGAFALGAASALMGKEAAMACTVAVETVIGEHYDNQIRSLMSDGDDGLETHKELLEAISEFRDEELEHLDTGLQHDAEKAPLYQLFSEAIKLGCKGAIWISERI